jgi:short subunit dehydrogenase-like uncharacterized protein
VGFDVIPTDCMAATLKEVLPDATHLVLAFDAGGSMSPGTARTLAQSMRLGQRSGRVRRNGVIEEVSLAHNWRLIDFAGGAAPAIAIPWGDLATAWFSTGIPNIETSVAVPRAAAIASRAINWVRPLLASAPGQVLLQRLANSTSGPSEEQLRTGRSRLWGEVRNAAGERRTAHLETANGYRLTADGTIMAVQFLLNAVPSGGRQGELVGVPIAGDDSHAVDIASGLIREIGFDPVVIGGLAMGKYLVPGTPLAGEHTTAEIRQIVTNLH